MALHIARGMNQEDKIIVRDKLIAFNYFHFPEQLRDKYQEVNLFIKNDDGHIYGGLIGEICWNWMEVHILIVDEQLRHQGYGTKLLMEAEKLAREQQCDFIKLDTLSFQALDFYKNQGYQIYGTIANAGGHTHYYLKKDL
ncbi:GNAT family N-acetyltransferase [Paenibacillus yanchengensis]|uniref:GNAT family N-acetyltransferase n=1 Tax=Paenibacillus yanchengensis TaxID=2035833 RepID=A0ABW4YGH4_9BACL